MNILRKKILSITNENNHKIFSLFGLKIKIRKKENISEQILDLTNSINQIKEKQNKYFFQLHSIFLLSAYKGCSIDEARKKIFFDYPKATGFLKSIQDCNLKLMKELQEICQNSNIKFWLHAGTLIGQLRHEGFIPWDDDVDVAMTRKDFNILKEILKGNKKIELCEYYNEITCSRQYQLKFTDKNIPLFLDVVIYDKCNAKTPEQIIKFRELYKKTREKMLYKFRNELHSPKIIDIGYYKVGLFNEKTKKEVDKIIDEANNLLISENEENSSFFYSVQNYPFAYPVMTYNNLFPLKIAKFEDSYFYIPNNSEEYLKGYGNIFIPPSDIGETKHIYAFTEKKDYIEKF